MRYAWIAEITCSSVTTGTVSYAQTAAGTNLVAGTCASGYSGSPQRNCSITGAWVDVGTASCTRTEKATVEQWRAHFCTG